MTHLEPEDLRKFRTDMGYTAKEFAAMIFTPVTTYLKWERGERRVPGIMTFVHQELTRRSPEK